MSMTIGMPSDVSVDPMEPEDDEMIGRSLDHFTIIDRIGGGGMGTVYRALDESLQRYVALKVIRRRVKTGDGSTDGIQLDRLLQLRRHHQLLREPKLLLDLHGCSVRSRPVARCDRYTRPGPL